LVGNTFAAAFRLVSLVSVWARNWTRTVELGEAVEKGEIIEIASIHAVVTHVAENMAGYQKRLGEYPTLSPTVASQRSPEF
jgi:hypothetical protein